MKTVKRYVFFKNYKDLGVTGNMDYNDNERFFFKPYLYAAIDSNCYRQIIIIFLYLKKLTLFFCFSNAPRHLFSHQRHDHDIVQKTLTIDFPIDN